MNLYVRAPALILVLVALLACSPSKPAAPTATASPAPFPLPPTAAVPTASSRATAGPATATTPAGNSKATDLDNGKSASLKVGTSVTVVLNSTYWRFAGSSDPAVLTEIGPAVTSPDAGKCLPGVGCGTVTATFEALSAGKAEITASRTSCGEALRCGPGQSSFDLTVIVGN